VVANVAAVVASDAAHGAICANAAAAAAAAAAGGGGGGIGIGSGAVTATGIQEQWRVTLHRLSIVDYGKGLKD
jgi:hypothetical protein